MIRWVLILLVLSPMVGGHESLASAATPSDPAKSVSEEPPSNPRAILKTSRGEIQVELFRDKAPLSVENFIRYARAGRYDRTLFHRVHRRIMIQGGGFTEEGRRVEAFDPVRCEADNGLKNNRGTLALVRAGGVHDATSSFFINVVDNHKFNHRGTKPSHFGYAVFGRVERGMKVVDAIKNVEVEPGTLSDAMPRDPVLLLEVTILPPGEVQGSDDARTQKAPGETPR